MGGACSDHIFVQIASYRDAELPRTIKDALARAERPERLTFGICWQFDEKTVTDLDPYLGDSRFRVDAHYYEDSMGCCWARHRTNQLYDGEAYTLQIDAHSRFADHWDSRYIEMLGALDCNKPALSTYPAPWRYHNGEVKLETNRGVQVLALKRMYRNLTTVFQTRPIDERSHPASSPFLGAGQIFTLGRFCREVEYDPTLYFSGEEISLSARAYTHGYDFFCPNEDLIWHLYQHSMPSHWSDHRNTQHQQAIEQLQTLFLGDHRLLGRYGLGPSRSLAQFQTHAGFSFKERLNRKPVKTHLKRTVELDVDRIPDRNDYDYWIFTLNSVEQEEIYRLDIRDPDVLGKSRRRIELDVHLTDEPINYMLWPHTSSGGFQRQYHRDL